MKHLLQHFGKDCGNRGWSRFPEHSELSVWGSDPAGWATNYSILRRTEVQDGDGFRGIYVGVCCYSGINNQAVSRRAARGL